MKNAKEMPSMFSILRNEKSKGLPGTGSSFFSTCHGKFSEKELTVPLGDSERCLSGAVFFISLYFIMRTERYCFNNTVMKM